MVEKKVDLKSIIKKCFMNKNDLTIAFEMFISNIFS